MLNLTMEREITSDLSQAAEELAALLTDKELRVVFAESCTAGLVSATLAQVPGVSEWHCGSAVTYRETTKTAWLNVSPQVIEEHDVVSAEVAQAMAMGVLQITPEADIAAAITGHLGPNAPTELDGVAYIAIEHRSAENAVAPCVTKIELQSSSRLDRQREAAREVLRRAGRAIS